MILMQIQVYFKKGINKMSLYNLMNGFNPACLLIMPMLGRKQSEYPRFRDCFVTEEGNIAIYTRVGGGNRNCGYGEEALYKDKNFIKTFDDEYDSTYATYLFSVPDDYIERVKEIFPMLAEEGFVDKVFGRSNR